MASPIDIFTQHPLTLDPTSKAISLANTSTTPTPSQKATLENELNELNALHRALLTLDPPTIPPPPLPLNPKRSAQITKLRDSANTAYRKNNTGEAIRLYTFAIDMAVSRPGWEPVAVAREELATLYGNRAQAYMSQREWVEGLVDARAAVEGKPVGNAKGWWRGGKCLAEMGRWEEAKTFLSRGVELEGRNSEGGKELLVLLEEVEEGLKRGGESASA
ncbi:uncharacterized protein BDV17DRAFT_287310 [Aspergillus undulatus]|uniref:uncharacterized protein n=1 Tax=Aspergillus undulatus TaxID=1810928 RepID=UPI003CCD1F01